MKKFLGILLLLSTFGFMQAQGFERFLSADMQTRLRGIKMINADIIEFDFYRDTWSTGSGTIYDKAWYFIEADSLGPLFRYHSSTFPGGYDFIRIPEGVLLNYYNSGNDCRDQFYMNMRVLDFADLGYPDFPRDEFPFIAGAYNHLYIKDSLFGYHGKPLCYEHGFDLSDNNHLHYYYYNYRTGEITYLDSLQLPFSFNHPGSLVRNPKTKQHLLFFDSVVVYINPGKGIIDSIGEGPKVMEDPMERHYRNFSYLQNQSQTYREVLDTLNSYAVEYRTDWLDSTRIVKWPKAAGYEDYYAFSKSRSIQDGDTIITYGLVKQFQTSQSIALIKLVNAKLRQELRYMSPPNRSYSFKDIASDQNGNFYLAGWLLEKPYVGRYYNDPNAYGFQRNIIVKVDSSGNSRLFPQSPSLSIQTWPSGLSFKTDDPNLLCDYQILDLGGRIIKRGEGRSGEIINLASAQRGFYFFQLWTKKGQFIGQEPFILN